MGYIYPSLIVKNEQHNERGGGYRITAPKKWVMGFKLDFYPKVLNDS
jgi:hypothetical protein